jgi:tetratricopeptide (TPR) repeat protein
VPNREKRRWPRIGLRTPCFLLVAVITGAGLLAACGGIAAQARSLERKGDLTGAVSLYRDTLKTDPNNIELLASLGGDLMILGKYDEALPVQERLVSLDAKDVQTRVELGFNYLNHQDRSADAVRVLTEATVLDPTAQHLSFLAQAQIVSGDTVGAERNLRRALEVEPQYAFSYAVLNGLLLGQGRTAEAAKVRGSALSHGVTVESTP